MGQFPGCDADKMWEYRKENIVMAVDVEPPDHTNYHKGGYLIGIAPNGRQFSSILLCGDEELLQLKSMIDSLVREKGLIIHTDPAVSEEEKELQKLKHIQDIIDSRLGEGWLEGLGKSFE